MAVKRVNEERHTSVTDTVETLMAWKNSIQCIATILPVKKNCKNCFLVTLMLVLVAIK
jgi:hypothetical protein